MVLCSVPIFLSGHRQLRGLGVPRAADATIGNVWDDPHAADAIVGYADALSVRSTSPISLSSLHVARLGHSLGAQITYKHEPLFGAMALALTDPAD